MKQTKTRLVTGLAYAAMVWGVTLASGANLVVNGDFESNTGNGQLGFNTSATGWSIPAPPNSYGFLFGPGTADTTGANGQFGNLALWGPGNGVNNGLGASPNGGFFVALDNGFQSGALSQTINGLTPGQNYVVSFSWAGSQQEGFTGASTDQLQVSLGAQTQSTAMISNPSQGFSGWMSESFTFTASTSSELLSFLATGGPGGLPPFALLDGISVNTSSVPEATSTLAISGLALAFLSAVARLRRKH